MSMRRAQNRSLTFFRDNRIRACTRTTKRMISGDALKYRNGCGADCPRFAAHRGRLSMPAGRCDTGLTETVRVCARCHFVNMIAVQGIRC